MHLPDSSPTSWYMRPSSSSRSSIVRVILLGDQMLRKSSVYCNTKRVTGRHQGARVIRINPLKPSFDGKSWQGLNSEQLCFMHDMGVVTECLQRVSFVQGILAV